MRRKLGILPASCSDNTILYGPAKIDYTPVSEKIGSETKSLQIRDMGAQQLEQKYHEEEKKLYLQALTKVDPELGEIQKALFEGVPAAKLKEITEKMTALINSRHGNSHLLEAKVHKAKKGFM